IVQNQRFAGRDCRLKLVFAMSGEYSLYLNENLYRLNRLLRAYAEGIRRGTTNWQVYQRDKIYQKSMNSRPSGPCATQRIVRDGPGSARSASTGGSFPCSRCGLPG